MKLKLRDIVLCVAVTVFLLLLVIGADAHGDRGSTLWMWEQPRLSVTSTPAPSTLVFVSPLPNTAPRRAVFTSPIPTPNGEFRP